MSNRAIFTAQMVVTKRPHSSFSSVRVYKHLVATSASGCQSWGAIVQRADMSSDTVPGGLED